MLCLVTLNNMSIHNNKGWFKCQLFDKLWKTVENPMGPKGAILLASLLVGPGELSSDDLGDVVVRNHEHESDQGKETDRV